MKKWTDGCEVFEDEQAARDNAAIEMAWDDVEEYFQENMSFHDFFTRVRENMPDFFDKFENEYFEAENKFFEDNYWEEEQDEEEEEEEE